MFCQSQLRVSLLFAAAIAGGWSSSIAGGQLKDIERQIFARARVFPEIGPGVSELKRDAAGRYYVLAAPATAIAVFDADGKRIGQIPAAGAAASKIAFAQDFDLDERGRLFVADRGANSVKIFAPDGTLAATIPVQAPLSIAALSGGDFAVTTLVSKRLVTVFDEHGTLISAFGDHIDSTDHPSLNELLNRGRVTGDLAGQIYFAFTYLPDPTIRKYDRSGFGAYVISLTAAEFGIAKQDQRKDIFGIERTSEAVSVQPVIGAVGVDSATQQVWASIGNSLVQFDKDGSRLLTYRTVTQDGVRVQPTAILIESDRLLLAADPIGVFDFARPDKAQPEIPKH